VVAEIVDAQQGDHAVVFYHDNELASLVGSYLLGAINDGGVAVIVATPEHRLWVNAWLMQAGLDLSTVTSNGSYLVLDARQTLNRFVLGDWPDAGGFWNTISPVLTTAIRRDRPVRVFGEMVALLWDAGLVESAIELEALWNEMAKRFSFSLLCAYPRAAVTADEHSDALAQVCAAHSHVAGLPEPDGPRPD
jgi:MEDS: MEthanogen/methylotroph, DcmR Sensory domain